MTLPLGRRTPKDVIPARPRTLAALLGLLAIVLGTLGVHRHVTVEIHATCEHGAEVHVDRIGEVGEAVHLPEPGGGPVLVDPVWWASEGDHHCGVVAPIVAAEPEFHPVPAPVLGAFAPEVPVLSRVAVATALFRLAPKTSPPISVV